MALLHVELDHNKGPMVVDDAGFLGRDDAGFLQRQTSTQE